MQPKNVPVNLTITPELFKEDCLQSTHFSSQPTQELLDYLFNPELDLGENSTQRFTTIKLYLTGGLSFDEFKRQIKTYDTSSVCGLVWSANYVAYRCRTCGISPCMSLCAECFMNGNHEGHDFNLFRSGAGGACDCGDKSVMSSSGFCTSHGEVNASKMKEVPHDLVASAKVLLSHLLYRLCQYLREKSHALNHKDSNPVELVNGLHVYLAFLVDLCELGTPIRLLIANTMLNIDFYNHKVNQEKEKYREKVKFSHETFVIANVIQETFRVPEQLKKLENAFLKPNYSNILDEILFWCIKFEFPEDLVKFLLVLLPENEYKNAFMKQFIAHYASIANILLDFKSDNLSTRVIHISVQLFSNEAITIKALHEYYLLPVVLATLDNVFKYPKCVKKNVMQDPFKNSHSVLDPDNRIIQDNLYWPIVSDLVNLLSHREVALSLLNDEQLVDLLLSIISHFQSMNLNIREFGSHVQFEQQSYYSSYSAELEVCSSIMWSFAQHLKDPSTIEQSKKLVKMSLSYLIKWFEAIGSFGQVPLNKEQVSFHLPLHRFVSVFIYNAVRLQRATLNEIVNNDESLMIDIIRHPLKIQASVYEIHSNMWIRNGLQMKGQVMTYFQNTFSTSFSEADLNLIQVLACNLNANKFVHEVLDAFRVFDYLNIVQELRLKDTTDTNQRVQLLTGALTLICQVVAIEPYLSCEDYQLTKREIINALCQSDRTHSQIEECLPEFANFSKNKKYIDEILKEVAMYEQPGGLKHGKYVPKDHIWLHEYDPLLIILRSVKLREFQEAFDRYCAFIKSKNLYPSVDTLWPPFRLPRKIDEFNDKRKILQSRVLHAFLFNILNEHLNVNQLPEKCIYLVVYILELGLHFRETCENLETFHQNSSRDTNYATWYETDDILSNLHVDIPFIQYKNDTLLDNRIKRICFDETATKGKVESSTCHLEINESLLSLLIRTMYGMTTKSSKKSLKKRVFEFKEPNDTRIGDEFDFISNLLNKASKMSEKCREKVSTILASLQITSNTLNTEKTNQKLKAQKRQKKIMQQMASNQKAFLETAKEFNITEEEDDDAYESIKFKESNEERRDLKTYNCCICRLSNREAKDKPIGIVTLLQQTSVLGNREKDFSNRHVSLSDEDSEVVNENLCWRLEEKRLKLLEKNFNRETSKYASNIGWRGGVFAQTCGHYLHFDCFKSYKETLFQHSQSLTIFSASEWSCPLCRQAANCLLPICDYPKLKAFENEAQLIGQVLENRETINKEINADILLPCINDALSSIMASTKAEYRDIIGDITNISMHDADKVTFLTSILRTQIEIGVLLKENPELSTMGASSHRLLSFIPLFDVLSMHCRLNCNEFKMHVKLWNILTGKEDNEAKYVPILLYDPIAVLILIVLNLPPGLNRTNYLYIVRVVHSLVYAQHIQETMDKLKQKSLTFLKSAYMLQTYLYEDVSQLEHFSLESLIENLCLSEIPLFKFDQNTKIISIPQEDMREILNLTNISYHRPELIRLPRIYSELFLYYSTKKCKFCSRTPRSPAICLVCGAHVCFKREFCCNEMRSLSAHHMNECSSGTGIFLSINSTYVYVVRALGRVGLWASLYLDKHDEEDIDLKRGKPLYLSKERFKLLTALWCNHLFDYNNLKWLN